MKPKSIRDCPKVGEGRHRFLQTGSRQAAHKIAASRGKKLPPLNNQMELPQIPFPCLIAGNAVFEIPASSSSRFAKRFRRMVIVNRHAI